MSQLTGEDAKVALPRITCYYAVEETTSVSIMADPNATLNTRAVLEYFHRTFTKLSPENLVQLFQDVNDVMGISGGSNTTTPNGFPLPAFSEHVLNIEKLGPNEEQYTMIDIPGIFRQETPHDSQTIILATMSSNINLTTQEILKLAKKVDPTMARTMAVLTKPDLVVENTTQQIVIDHVLGK
ncbi:hypothetical protein CHU98_g3378 [Xylaria longipes]|nr:hypothetical protein CHU98_g3378 [Xylaria longipes]